MTEIIETAGRILERVRNTGDKEPMEYVLLGLFVSVSLYMFVAAFEFSSDARLFPQFTTGVVLVLSMLLIFETYLPGPLKQYVDESEQSSIADGTDERDDSRSTEHETTAVDTTDKESPSAVSETGAVVLAGLCLGYLVLSFLVGILWATPVFVFTYSFLAGHPRRVSVALAALIFGIAYLFAFVLSLPIDTGYLLQP